MATPTLYRQITAGTNGARIYADGNRYYLVDGEIDCSAKNASADLKDRAYASDRDPAKLERAANRNSGR